MIGALLAQNAQHFDSATTLKVLIAHDAAPLEIAMAATASGDVGPAAAAALSVRSAGSRRKGAVAAIKMLEKADMAKFSSIFFRHAKALFTRAPVETADSFLRRYKDGLDPEKLLPAMIYVVKEIEERRRKRERKKGRQQKGGGEANPMGAPPPGLQEENSSEEEGGSEEEEEEGSEQEVEEEGEGESEEMAAEQQEGIVKYLEGAVKLGCNSVAVHR